MSGWSAKIVLWSVCLVLCRVEVGTANQSGEPGYPRTIRFQIENDRLSGSDDGHTYSLRLFAEWPNRRPETSVSISYESLTFRKENTRVDLLGFRKKR